MKNKKTKFAELSDLIGVDPNKTYMGGGYKREDIRIHDIVVEEKLIRAYCDVRNDYTDTKTFHLTQPAAYSCSSQLLVAFFAYTRNIERQAKGFHVFLSNYTTEWNKVIKVPNNIPVEVKEVNAVLKKRTEKITFKVTIGDNNAATASYTVVFRFPGSAKRQNSV